MIFKKKSKLMQKYTISKISRFLNKESKESVLPTRSALLVFPQGAHPVTLTYAIQILRQSSEILRTGFKAGLYQ